MSTGSIPPQRAQPNAEFDDEELDDRDPVRYRGSGSDPTFGYLLALALSFGLLPLIPNNADMRYTLVWGLLGSFGVLSWLFGTTTRIERDKIENIVWGAIFGLIVATPLLLFGGTTLTTTVHLMFSTGSGTDVRPLPSGAVLAYLVFVMPMAETLFFRGLMQHNRAVVLVGGLSSILSIALFVPMLEVAKYPLIALIISIVLVLINLMYSYVRQRSGLAAAWVCQIVVNVVLLFLPYLTL